MSLFFLDGEYCDSLGFKPVSLVESCGQTFTNLRVERENTRTSPKRDKKAGALQHIVKPVYGHWPLCEFQNKILATSS